MSLAAYIGQEICLRFASRSSTMSSTFDDITVYPNDGPCPSNTPEATATATAEPTGTPPPEPTQTPTAPLPIPSTGPAGLGLLLLLIGSLIVSGRRYLVTRRSN